MVQVQQEINRQNIEFLLLYLEVKVQGVYNRPLIMMVGVINERLNKTCNGSLVLRVDWYFIQCTPAEEILVQAWEGGSFFGTFPLVLHCSICETVCFRHGALKGL